MKKERIKYPGQKDIQTLFWYDEISGVLKWKVARGGRNIGDPAGTVDRKKGYLRIKCTINKKRTSYLAHRLIFIYMYGYNPEGDLDHINGDKLDNRINNIREISSQCNRRNCRVQKNNKSGIKGISWKSSHKKWCVQIGTYYSVHYLGLFEDFDEAVCMRLAAEQCLNWYDCENSSSSYRYVCETIQKGRVVRNDFETNQRGGDTKKRRRRRT